MVLIDGLLRRPEDLLQGDLTAAAAVAAWAVSACPADRIAAARWLAQSPQSPRIPGVFLGEDSPEPLPALAERDQEFAELAGLLRSAKELKASDSSFAKAAALAAAICERLGLEWRLNFSEFEESRRDAMRARGKLPVDQQGHASSFDVLREGRDWIEFRGLFFAKLSALNRAAKIEGYLD